MKQTIAFIPIIFILFISCNEKVAKEYTLTGNAFGTTYNIKFFSSEKLNALKGIDSVINAVNQSVSTYSPVSDISRINMGDATLTVDSIFKEVFQISETIYKKSNGYFDPTVGVLRNAYGFGEEKPLVNLDQKTLDSLRQYVGFYKVRINEDGTVSKKHPQIYFDFNAVAKGYGIDCIGRYFDLKGVANYIIEIGGEVLAKGENLTKTKPWVAGIESIDSQISERTYAGKVVLKNRGLAASGNYRKYRIDSVSGKKYVHTINPLSGLAEETNLTSATVIAPSCALADAYATTFMAMGLEQSKTLLKELDSIEAYLTYVDKNQDPQVFITKGFKQSMLE